MAPVLLLRSQYAALFLFMMAGFLEGGKVLVVPVDGSHWLSMKQLVENLSQRGHQVVVVMPEVSWQMGKALGYTVQMYPVSYTKEELDAAFQEFVDSHLIAQPFPLNIISKYITGVSTFNLFFSHCKSLFSNKELMQYLKQSDFDILLTDPVSVCGTIVANYFSVPFVLFMRGLPCSLHYRASQCPNPQSYIPRLFTENSDYMSFSQKLKNVWVDFLELFYCDSFYAEAVSFATEILQRKVTILDLLNSASILLLRFDFVLEYPRPVMPNMVFIGGINCAGRKALSEVCFVFLFPHIKH
ncbi:PREDICTED: UDP-glucuronosyltransferase 1-8-like [Crocodylus porosus]|uniref:UDP-glucuronosyltransferase 1-8-like n=1 Tax=Crocodylus porosus TaxID=8502 RepID=UPI00093A74A8|nr:PREDICTED: UDP-glucuronosyltransferase 1-8-like [Crocodylus porosus]